MRVTISGPPGCGKTTLGIAILKMLHDAEVPCQLLDDDGQPPEEKVKKEAKHIPKTKLVEIKTKVTKR